ncbi:MAG: ribonuclease HI [Crocinitomicaceae bacterium]|jgi:ribonuclease HI|tara:strand:+ start:7513 stop:7989 length:477 start_codon:yes stop_codon:yes gene_type:complete
MSLIEIYTDGSSRGNPGPGGYGVVMSFKDNEKELSQGFRKTTNNRMELLGVIVAVESLKTKDIPVKVYSDSKYVIDAITKGWLDSWIIKRFKGKKNQDLWMRYHEAAKGYKITFEWVKGHAGNPKNERCDVLAVESSKQKPLLIDHVFEANEERKGLF